MFGHVESNIFVTCNISDEEEEEVFSVEEGNKIGGLSSWNLEIEQ